MRNLPSFSMNVIDKIMNESNDEFLLHKKHS